MNILRVSDTGLESLVGVFAPFGLSIETVEHNQAIPGSHWGDEEAGLIHNTLYARDDTPVHSVFHEACHWVLMDDTRRESLHTNAGGTLMEENAVCYLQILLADKLATVGQARMQSDMDAWGYTFRLGSAKRWFEEDAEDARAFLLSHRLTREGLLNIP